MNEILQGTTPTLTIEIQEEIPVSSITALELTLRHSGTVTILHRDQVTINATENTVSYRFSEAETLALDPVSPLEWQLRVQTADGIFGTPKSRINVLDLISQEMIS